MDVVNVRWTLKQRCVPTGLTVLLIASAHCTFELNKFMTKCHGSWKSWNNYTWKTTKLRSLFRMKDKVRHSSNVIYKGECSCKAVYIGETTRNAETRWKERNSDSERSKPSKHLNENPDHSFTWKVIRKAPSFARKRKILEAYFIMTLKPSINDQKDIKKLQLFRNMVLLRDQFSLASFTSSIPQCVLTTLFTIYCLPWEFFCFIRYFYLAFLF